MKEKETWLTYDWEMQGKNAVFHVDLRYGSTPVPGYDTALLLELEAKEHGRSFRTLESIRVESLRKRCLSQLRRACFIGRIDMPGLTQLYFYTALPSNLMYLESLCAKEHLLAARCDRQNDPNWDIYCRILYPDAARFQTVSNKDQVSRMKKMGDNPQALRRVTLYAFFAAEPKRLAFEEDVRQAGFAIDSPLFRGEQDLPHGSAVTCVTSLLPQDINRITTRIIRAAAPYGGELMGWQCVMVPRKNPLE